MKLSIVIPTYNRDHLLLKGLLFLSEQVIKSEDFELEVIIVDDGSTDRTAEYILDVQKSIKNLIHVYLPRDSGSNLSRARNAGLNIASGDIICFMDSGILVPADFSEKIMNIYKNGNLNKLVLVHNVYGLILEDSKENIIDYIETLTPYNLQEHTRTWKKSQSWVDVRESIFDAVGDDLGKLPAPWTLAWGAMVTVSRQLATEIGGYDESYFGWGVEDQDFSYRLYLKDAIFMAERQAFGFHIPHPTAKQEAKKKSISNRKQMHQKFYTLETELFYLYNGLYYNHILAKLNTFVISNAFQSVYPASVLGKVSECLSVNPGHSLLLGFDDIPITSLLYTTHIFVHNKTVFKRFNEEYKDRSIHYLLGCDTFFENKYFELVIMSDFVLVLGERLLKDILLEMQRISKQIVFLYGNIKKFTDDSYRLVGIERLKEIAKEFNLIIVFVEF
ncbi:glycosyltransferase family 2 protein [Paenibacillus medicaginis]|uniref:Glycosyltransferase family 2 protein n=1 Tax=Paenibacillus medicaginis TaxID=1470560 RepID=A0ABV5BVD9_9BACL